MHQIKASIIIPTKDKLTRLRLVLKLLEPQITNAIEVIIIFDGCSPETIADFAKLQFRFTPLPLIRPENVGRSAARNLGIKLARGKILIFFDDDRIPSANFVKQHLRAQKNPCVVLGERHDIHLTDAEIENLFYLNEPQSLYGLIKAKASIAAESTLNLRRKLLYGLNGPFGWMNFYTGNVPLPRKPLIAAGGFDENFRGWGHEDLELGYRLHHQGLRFIKNTGIVNYHLLHPSNAAEKFRESLKNLKYMIRKCRKDPAANLLLRVMLAKIYLERLTRRI